MEPPRQEESFMRNMRGIRSERLDHLGIVAGVCQEIGLAAYLDAEAGPTEQQVRAGTATVAMILNGLGIQQSPPVSRAPRTLPPSPSSICWGQGSPPTSCTTSVWDAPSTGSMPMTRPRCLLGSRAKPVSALGWRRVRCMWTALSFSVSGAECAGPGGR